MWTLRLAPKPRTLIPGSLCKDRDLPDSPVELPDHPIKGQRHHNEWEVSCCPLWDMAHMSARNGCLCQQLSLSSTHYPLIPFTHTLSLEWRARKRKGWTRVRKWRRRRWRRESSLQKAARSDLDQGLMLHQSFIPWLAQELYLLIVLRSILKP